MFGKDIKHLNTLCIDVAIANEGIENFTFEIIEEFPLNVDQKILRESERKWIKHYDVENNPLHYNKGFSLSQIKYDSFWDSQKVLYVKSNMFSGGNNGDNPRRCFKVNAPKQKSGWTYRLPIGTFNEFVSPTIIYDLVKKWS